jgi:hypothetical protein
LAAAEADRDALEKRLDSLSEAYRRTRDEAAAAAAKAQAQAQAGPLSPVLVAEGEFLRHVQVRLPVYPELIDSGVDDDDVDNVCLRDVTNNWTGAGQQVAAKRGALARGRGSGCGGGRGFGGGRLRRGQVR